MPQSFSDTSIEKWAGQFVAIGADMAAINKEIAALNMVGEVVSPQDAAKLRNEFIKQTLHKMNHATLSKQYAGWKRFK